MDDQTTTWRLFVALPVPEVVKTELQEVQAALRSGLSPGSVRWTHREQLHLTLRFLGDVDSQRVEALILSLHEGVEGFPVMPLRAERIGFFPSLRFPRVVWAGVQDQAECLPMLQQAVNESVKGFTIEKPEAHFIGHVTLGRCQKIDRADAGSLSAHARRMDGRLFGEWKADAVELIRSELLPEGPRYTALATIPLAEHVSDLSGG